MERTCILVIDDERRYRELLALNFERRGYRVVTAPNGLGGLNILERDAPDLVLLDLNLPDMDGYEVCQRIREYSQVPLIMLTGRTEEPQKVRGLRLGADDYVTKPFGPDELVARVEAVLRRRDRAALRGSAPYQSGELVIDFAERTVLVRGEEVDLTATEYRLLQHLAQNAGRVVVQEDLLRHGWGPGYEADADLLHTAVRRLRQKIEADPHQPRYILTRRGVGYLLERRRQPRHDS